MMQIEVFLLLFSLFLEVDEIQQQFMSNLKKEGLSLYLIHLINRESKDG